MAAKTFGRDKSKRVDCLTHVANVVSESTQWKSAAYFNAEAALRKHSKVNGLVTF
jgi:hypothetical protein